MVPFNFFPRCSSPMFLQNGGYFFFSLPPNLVLIVLRRCLSCLPILTVIFRLSPDLKKSHCLPLESGIFSNQHPLTEPFLFPPPRFLFLIDSFFFDGGSSVLPLDLIPLLLETKPLMRISTSGGFPFTSSNKDGFPPPLSLRYELSSTILFVHHQEKRSFCFLPIDSYLIFWI